MRCHGATLQCVLLVCLLASVVPKVAVKQALKKVVAPETVEDVVDAAADEPEEDEEEQGSAKEGRCTGCKNQHQADSLFGHIASTIQLSTQLSYLALDMDWQARLLADDARVHVSYHDFSKVSLESATTLSDDLHLQSLSFFHDKNEFKDFNPKYYDSDGCKLGTQCQAGKNETETAEKRKNDGNDGNDKKPEKNGDTKPQRHYFVKRNRRRRRRLDGEPVPAVSGSKDDSAKSKEKKGSSEVSSDASGDAEKASASSKDATTSSAKTSPTATSRGVATGTPAAKTLSLYDEEFQVLAFGFDKWKDISPREYEVRLDHFLAVNPCWVPLHEPTLPFADESYGEGGDPDELTTHSVLLLARLPSHSFYATCKLYKSLVARQFPPVCFYKQNRMAVFHLGNLGYGHVLTYLLHAFVSTIEKSSYRQRKLFSVPMAHRFLSRVNRTMTNQTHGGKYVLEK
jgi:hypothetical protein